MPELKNTNGGLTYVDSMTHYYGEVSEDAVIEYSFKFLKDGDEIEYLEKGCGCTSTEYSDNEIKGTLNLAKAKGNTAYLPGETVVTKYVFVWLNDGQPRFIADSLKRKLQNPKKKWFRLTISGMVVK